MAANQSLAQNQLNILPLLSPAETMIVLLGVDAPFTELLKVTFMDLVLKRVLVIDEITRQPSSHDPQRTYRYIRKGKKFDSYLPLHHENIYIDAFNEVDNEEILLRNVIKSGYDNVTSSGLYRSHIIRNKQLLPYYHQNILQRLNGHFTLDAEGISFEQSVKSEFSQAVAEIKQYMIPDPERAGAVIKMIGGNLFLIHDLDFSLLRQFDQELMIEIEHSKTTFTDSIAGNKGSFKGTWV